MIDFTKMSGRHISQISHMQQAIWDLEKARTNIAYATGNSDLGNVYTHNIADLMDRIQGNIDAIHAEYELSE